MQNDGKTGQGVTFPDDDLPSAPPLYDSIPETKEGSDEFGVSPNKKGLQEFENDSAITDEKTKANGDDLQKGTQFVRFLS